MIWNELIDNRNQSDLYNNDRGYINHFDLNRINKFINGLAAIAGMDISAKTDFAEGDFIYERDVMKIASDISALWETWPTLYPSQNPEYYNLYPPVYPLNHFEQFNAIEEMLGRMLRIYEGYIGPDVYIGEMYLGEEIGVLHGV